MTKEEEYVIKLVKKYGYIGFLEERIEEQQKEIEELQYKLKEHISFEGHKQFEELKRNSIPKETIKGIIENTAYPDMAIFKINRLLEE